MSEDTVGTLRRTLALFVFLIVLLLPGLAHLSRAADTPLSAKNVLVLHSYNQTYAWTDQEMEGIMRVFQKVDPTYMPQVEYLDWKRYPDQGRIKAFGEFFRSKYRGVRFDAVIVTDNKALDFALQYRSQLFPGAAISFCGINAYQSDMIAGLERVSGVVEDVDPVGTLNLITALLPETREIVVLIDDSESSLAVLAALQNAMEGRSSLKLRVLNKLNFNELIEAVSPLRAGSVILQGPYLRDRDGRSFNFEKVLEHILPHVRVPIFSLWDFLAGKGITGGSLLSGVLQGQNAAEIALRMMNGEKRVPVMVQTPTRTLLDFRQLAAFGLEGRPLPKGVEVINLPPSFVRQHLGTIIATVATMTFLVVIIIALVLAIRRKDQAERSLRESEERYRTVVDNIPLGISLIGRDYRILMTNRTRAEMLGGTAESLRGVTCYGELKNREESCARCPGTVSMATGATSHAVTEQVRDDGSRRHYHFTTAPLKGIDGVYYGFIEVVEDITERKLAEELTKTNERRLESLYEISKYQFTNEAHFLKHALEEVIKLTDCKIGYIYFYNEQKRLFTLSSWSQDVMQECAVVEHQETYHLDGTGIWGEVVRQGRPIVLNDFEAPHPLKKGFPEGHAKLKRFMTIPVVVEGGIVAVVGVANKETDFQDVDVMQLTLFMDSVWKTVTRKRFEEERLQLEKQLLHAQKLESLGVLAGGIAHDFNNILMAIIGNADLALMRIEKELPVIDNLHRIENAAAQAADLAKQMLAYSGKGKFVIENLDLNRLLERMLHMLEVSISKKAVLRLELNREIPSVEADATQMRQIIMNLVINASEAIGDSSGVITITTGCIDCNRSYLKNVWLDENIKEGLYAYLEVADTGCGMDTGTLEKIFDPFFTTKFTGRGLGMAAVLGIVRGHKGAIKVHSEPGKGTAFKVLLPASGRLTEIFGQDQLQDEWQGAGKVLLVDDEETVRCIGREMLGALGFETVTANDGREALEIYKRSPDLAFVILDLTMPHMDGEQCFRELREMNPAVKVIMSSGYHEQEVTQKFVGKGLAGFVQKPYRISALKEAIRGMTGS